MTKDVIMVKPSKPRKTRKYPLEKIEEDSIKSRVKITWKEVALLGIVAALVVLVAVFIIAGGKGREQGVKPAAVGAEAPEFRLPTPDGRLVGLTDYRGKVVMVHFWATWCPPCVEEIPALERLYDMFKGRDFEILAVNIDEGSVGVVTSFLQKNGVSFPVLLDPQRAVPTLYGTFKFPESYIVDRQGVVRDKIIGPLDWTAPENVAALDRMLQDR